MVLLLPTQTQRIFQCSPFINRTWALCSARILMILRNHNRVLWHFKFTILFCARAARFSMICFVPRRARVECECGRYRRRLKTTTTGRHNKISCDEMSCVKAHDDKEHCGARGRQVQCTSPAERSTHEMRICAPWLGRACNLGVGDVERIWEYAIVIVRIRD